MRKDNLTMNRCWPLAIIASPSFDRGAVCVSDALVLSCDCRVGPSQNFQEDSQGCLQPGRAHLDPRGAGGIARCGIHWLASTQQRRKIAPTCTYHGPRSRIACILLLSQTNFNSRRSRRAITGEREFGATTMAVSAAQLAKLKDMVRDFAEPS